MRTKKFYDLCEKYQEYSYLMARLVWLHAVALEFVKVLRGDSRLDAGIVIVVVEGHNLADLVNACNCGGLIDGNVKFQSGSDGTQAVREEGPKLVEAEFLLGGDADRRGIDFGVAIEDFRRFQSVDFVEDHECGFVQGINLFENLVDGLDLLIGLGMANVHNVNQEVGFRNFFQGRLEGFDEAVGEFLDEANRVGEQDSLVCFES